MALENSIDNQEYVIFVSETEVVFDDSETIYENLDQASEREGLEFDNKNSALICRMQDDVVRRVLSILPSEKFSRPPKGYVKVVAKKVYKYLSFESLGQNIIMYEFLRDADEEDRPSVTGTTLTQQRSPVKRRYVPSGEYAINPERQEPRKPPIFSGIPGAITDEEKDDEETG